MHQSGIPALIILQFSSDEIVATARLNLVRSIPIKLNSQIFQFLILFSNVLSSARNKDNYLKKCSAPF
jgi:hypothetical protein